MVSPAEAGGLTAREAERRLADVGPNVVADRRGRWYSVLLRQLANPLLLLLAATAIVSILLAERSDAVIILCIVGLRVGLGLCW
jgi:P-type Mg2+ transporter